MSLETVTSLTFETSKVAMSVAPFGTVWGVQLAAVFQSLVIGLRSQVALPATDMRATANKATARGQTKHTSRIRAMAVKFTAGLLAFIRLCLSKLKGLVEVFMEKGNDA